MIIGNKGEWSEIYALFKLLGDKHLYSGDKNLNKVEELFYPILKIIRQEKEIGYEYAIQGDLVIISGGKEELRIPVNDFLVKSAELLQLIKGNSGTFSLPEVESFMYDIHCISIKAISQSKKDIRIVIHDQKVSRNTELGFSIKSQIGADSTLLNAGKTTNFIFEIIDFKPSQNLLEEINNIDTRSKIKDRISEIHKHGGHLKFIKTENDIFKNNLVLIDSCLPNIIAEIVHKFYTSPLTSIKNLIENITRENPLQYDNQFDHNFYEYKIKRFLTDVALGMTPSKVWNGEYDATGGYLIVKENGDVLCYHIYNRNQFEEYLFANTKLETASTTKYLFGKIYEQNNTFFFKLNLQVRFK
jgi:HpaII restriction endonuclease